MKILFAWATHGHILDLTAPIKRLAKSIEAALNVKEEYDYLWDHLSKLTIYNSTS